MSLQLFSFGHPCEHQLRRTCIGGSSCPLNGYPDTWCCSFIKGKINFKRDKPCEGPRCRWGFTHPSQSQFDAVTHVLNESRPIVAKIDDGDEKEQLSFNIENPHIVDTVQCALHMMRNPPSGRATRVGQLLAYAALRAADPKVFMQLLKTLKKPVDGYLLGAYDYLTGGNLPVTPLPAAVASHANAQGGKSAGKKGGHSEKKEDVSEELRNDMVDLMNAALSSGGQLVNREDQHTLQAVFIQALRSYPKSNKKRQEMLELAVAKFGSRPVAKNTAATTAAASQATPGNTAVTNNTASTTTSAATANTPRHAGAVSMAAAAAGAGTTNTSTTAPTATTATTTTATVNTTALGKSVATSLRSPSGMGATGAAVHAGGGSNTNSNNSNTTVGAGAYSSRNPSKLSDVLDEDEGGMHSHSNNHHGANSNNNMTTIRRPQAIGGSSTALSLNPRVKDSSSMSPAKQQQPTLQEPSQQQQQQLQPPAHPQPVVGISRLAQQMRQNPPRHYEPIRTDLPLPPVALLGGLLGLTQQSAAWALLGGASSHKASSAVPNTPAAAAAAASATVGSGSPFAEAEAELDNKVLRFLSSSGPGYNYFGGIDGLPADQQCLKVVYDD